MIGAMLMGNPAQLPQRVFDAFRLRLEALTETERDGLDIRVGKDKVIDQMRKWFSCDGDAQIAHVRKIGLSAFAGCMHLLKEHLALRPRQRAPAGNMPA